MQRILFRFLQLATLAGVLLGAWLGSQRVSPSQAATGTRRAWATINLTINPATNNAGAVAELINALNTANSDPAADTINLFPCGVYTLMAPHNFEFGPNALPIIRSDITLNGQGAKLLRAAGAPRFRFFYVAGNGIGGLATGTLTLRELTLEGGLARGGNGSGGGMGAGGALFNHGNVTLERVTLAGNTALGGSSSRNVITIGGGGMGEDGGSTRGGGFGGLPTGTGGLGANGSSHSGGGGGFRSGDDGAVGGVVSTRLGGNGGGQALLGGVGGEAGFFSSGFEARRGDGGGGGSYGLGASGTFGGDYGKGGLNGNATTSFSGGGGGVGGGGGGTVEGGGGGGGFGGGGGVGVFGQGGEGGFGGGAGQGFDDFGRVSVFGGGDSGRSYPSDIAIGARGGGGGMGAGGAIFNHLGTLALLNTTLSGNTAQGGNGTDGSGDMADGGGGGSGLGAGLFNLNGTVMVIHSTIAANAAIGGTGGAAGGIGVAGKHGEPNGAAIYNLAFGRTFTGGAVSATVTLNNSILAVNTGAIVGISGGGSATKEIVSNQLNGTGNVATVNYTNNNLVMSQAALNSAAFNGSATSTANPLLGALQVNPGSTACPIPTMALALNSPALNAAVCLNNVTTDARGIARPDGGGCDLGAFELSCVLAFTPISFTPTRTGATDGGIAITSSGNQGAVQFSVDNGATFQASNIFSGLAAGTYNVVVKDTFCQRTAVVNLVAASTPPNNCPINQSATAGSPAQSLKIATVSDADQAAGALSVSIISANPANGVTLSNLTNSGGNIFANVQAACGATGASFTLQVSDGGGLTRTGTINVAVNPNTPPALAYASPQRVTAGGALVINPTTNPSDNGTFSFGAPLVTPAGFGGSLNVANSGVVTLNHAGPAGTYNVTVPLSDNCGATTNAQFMLITCPVITLRVR